MDRQRLIFDPFPMDSRPSSMTGVNPGKHGVSDFAVRSASGLTWVSSRVVRSPKLVVCVERKEDWGTVDWAGVYSVDEAAEIWG